MRVRDVIILVCVAVIWGLNFAVIRWGLNSFPPLLFSGLRFTLCAAPILFGVRRPQIGWCALLTLGVTLGLLVFTFLYLGIYVGVSAGLASVLMQAQVFFTIIFSFMAGQQRLTFRSTIATIIGFCGLAVIAAPLGQHAAGLGLMLILAGAASWGISNVLIKRLPPVKMLNLMIWISLVPPVPLFALSYGFEGKDIIVDALSRMTIGDLGSLLYTSVLSTLVAYGLWGAQIRKFSNLAVAPYALLVPIVGMAASSVFFGTDFTLPDLLGTTLTLAALAINASADFRTALAGPSDRLPHPPFMTADNSFNSSPALRKPNRARNKL